MRENVYKIKKNLAIYDSNKELIPTARLLLEKIKKIKIKNTNSPKDWIIPVIL